MGEPKFAFLSGDDAFALVDDGSQGPANKGKPVCEIKEWPTGDDVLVAMREAYSLTYSSRRKPNNARDRLPKIREIAVKALQPIGNIVRTLRLAPVNVDPEDLPDCRVFKYMIAPMRDLRPKVLIEGTKEKKPFIDLIEWLPADPIIISLRRILSLSFEEVFTENDHIRLMARIRRLAAESLVPYNKILERIEIEPVAIPHIMGDEFIDLTPDPQGEIIDNI